MSAGKTILIVVAVAVVASAIVFRDDWVPDGRADIVDAPGQFQQGEMYQKGWGRAADPIEAIHWYTLAAEQNHPEAQFRLGESYFKGMGIRKDRAKGLGWYVLAAENQHVEAMVQLAWMYTQGEGVTKDLDEADRLTRLVAELGPLEVQP
jgi:TPR repeat protein